MKKYIEKRKKDEMLERGDLFFLASVVHYCHLEILMAASALMQDWEMELIKWRSRECHLLNYESTAMLTKW